MEEKIKEKEKTYKCSTEEFNLAIQVARSCQGQRPIQLFYRTEITRIIHVMDSAYYKSSSMLPSIFQKIQHEEEHTTSYISVPHGRMSSNIAGFIGLSQLPRVPHRSCR